MTDKVKLPPYRQRAGDLARGILTSWVVLPRIVRDMGAALRALCGTTLVFVFVLVSPLLVLALPLWVFIGDRVYIHETRRMRAEEALREAMLDD